MRERVKFSICFPREMNKYLNTDLHFSRKMINTIRSHFCDPLRNTRSEMRANQFQLMAKPVCTRYDGKKSYLSRY